MVKKITYDAIVAEWRALNIAWNVTEEDYVEMNTKLKATFHCTIHADEESWNAKLGVMRKGKTRCSQCKESNLTKYKTKADTDMLLLSMGVNRLEITGAKCSKGNFQCLVNPDHMWEETTQQLTIRGYGCYKCRGKTDNGKVHKLYEEDVLPKIQEMGYTLLSKYEATDQIGEFSCSKGHTWKTHIGNVYRELSGCPYCSSRSSEARAIFIIEKLLDLEFKKTRRVLPCGYELDGYNVELMLAIEYNGAQHYIKQPTLFHREEGSFEAQQARDKKKRKECVDLGIELITIHYKLNTFDKIREYIESELLRLNYTINKNLNWDDLKKTFRSNCDSNIEAFNIIKEIVESKNGKCLSTNYIGRLDPMRFKCEVAEHPEFEKTPAAIRRNGWCDNCPHIIDLSSKVACECGSMVGKKHFKKHETSKKHLQWMSNN